MTTHQRLRVGIIGTGNIAPAHVAAYLAFGDACELVAACDLVPDKAHRLMERFGVAGVTVYADAAEMLEREDLDLVSVATPPNTHAELAIAVLDSGAHALVEKPMAPSLAECDAMLEAARASGRTLGVVAQNRFRDDMALLKRVVESGLLGSLSHTQISSTWWRSREYYDLWWRGTWASEGGGCLLNHAVHHVDLGLWLLGRPRSVTAVMTNAQHDNAEIEDLAVAIWEYERGLAELTASVVHHGQEHAIVIQGADASVAQPWRVVAERGQPNGFPDAAGNPELVGRLEGLADAPPLDHTGHTGQIGDLLAAIASGGVPAITAEDGRRSVELITAMYASAIERRTVDLPLSPEDPYYADGHLVSRAPHFFEKSASVRELDGEAQIGLAPSAGSSAN